MPKRIFIVATILVLLLTSFIDVGTSTSSTNSQITYINVGQGDSALLQDPAGTDVLIDGGPASAGDTVVNYVRSHTDHNLEAVIVTHADADHSGGLVTLLQADDISIDIIYYNGYAGDTQTWSNLVNLANNRSINMVAAQFPAEYTWGQFKAYILNPAAGLSSPEQNDASVVARIDYLNTRFLFTGDISSAMESTVIARQTPVAAQVLKVAHHGSRYSSSDAFLAAVQPADGVISVGPNSYGHPASDALVRLDNAGVRVSRTDQQGNLIVLSDGSTVTFTGLPTLDPVAYLPLIIRDQPAPPTPYPPPSGVNVQCNTSGAAEICAWVSDGAPAQNANVTVYGRLIINNTAQNGQAMNTTWHYKSTTSACSGTTGTDGVAFCTRPIGRASLGYQVNVDVSINGYTAATWFTPQ